jgi:cysteine desulfurase
LKRVYLDNNATTPVSPEVLEAMLPFFKENFGNPSSIHWAGREARKYLDISREQVANLLNCRPSEIVFTSSGTESDNFAIKGVAELLKDKGNHIITTRIEHPAVLNTCKYLETEGYRVTYLPVDSYGMVDPEDVKKAIDKDTILISIMWANNEIGNILPIEEIGKIAKERRIYFHTDAVQAVGKIPIDLKSVNVDLLSMSGHKIHAPKGVGVLYIKNGIKLMPLIHGGHHEKNRRAGTENLAGIVGLGKACEIAKQEFNEKNGYLTGLRDRLYNGIINNIDNVKLNGHPVKRIPTTLNLSFEFVEGEGLLLSLDLEGIAASTGSACSSGSLEPSHVLTAMGIRPEIAQGAIRFSIGKYNTPEEIDYVIEVLPKIVERLRSMSPLYNK